MGTPLKGAPRLAFETWDFKSPGSNYLRMPSFVITVLYRSESYFFR
jgi:hypothetical protein